MRKLLTLTALTLLSLPAVAQVRIEVGLPVVQFEAPPPLVVVEPGVQVVEDSDEAIYFVNNVYWVRRGDNWYSSNDHRGHWVAAYGRDVPSRIQRMPPGRYRHYRAENRRAEPVRAGRADVRRRDERHVAAASAGRRKGPENEGHEHGESHR